MYAYMREGSRYLTVREDEFPHVETVLEREHIPLDEVKEFVEEGFEEGGMSTLQPVHAGPILEGVRKLADEKEGIEIQEDFGSGEILVHFPPATVAIKETVVLAA